MVTETATSEVENHIDWSFVALKDFKYFAQETMSQQHSGRLNVDCSNAIFCGYGFKQSTTSFITNNRTRGFFIHGVFSIELARCISVLAQ
jgi:hypothetical protein